MQESEHFEIMARTAAMSRAEQDEAIGAGFAALREASQSADETSTKFTFDALSAVLDGVAESRLEEIAAACRSASAVGLDPDQVANALAQAIVQVDQQLGRGMLAESIAAWDRPAGVRSKQEDYLYRAWAVTGCFLR